MHYLTLGQPECDSKGVVRNAVLILHGTTGSSAHFLAPQFANERYGKGQPLDATRYYLIIPDSLGHGKSGKSSDGLREQFQGSGYFDMIEAQYRLLTEGLRVTHLRPPGHLDGRNARVIVAGASSRFHGRAHAAG